MPAPEDRKALTAALKAEARRLGFQLVGVTTPEPPPHLEIYARWLSAGRHGEMEYLASERALARRADPRRILPEVRSILVLGIRYPAPAAHPGSAPTQPAGRVAAYAWGEDYHLVLPNRLRALVAFLETRVGHAVPNRWYSDTGPLLEREFAQRAGLGWIGKNTCLIHPRHGSYFLLAEILLGIDLEPNPPLAHDFCGSCTHCLDACPTSCILPDRTLDARRCISYLTIELKGSIPQDLRPPIGDWVFGCDICQQVCPWNQRFATPQGDPAFAPRPDVPRPHLRTELAMTPEAFRTKFRRSPLKRAKRHGYLRNVAVALGNSGEPAAVEELTQALQQDPEPLVRAHAAWALGQIGGRATQEALRLALASEPDPQTRAEIHSAIERCTD